MIRVHFQSFMFPILIGLIVTSVFIFHRLGMDPDLWIAYTYGGTAILLTCFEYIFPRDPSWNYFSKKGFRLKEAAMDTGFYFYGEVLSKIILLPVASFIVDYLKTITDLPIVLPFNGITQIILLVLLIDFMRYWIHRLQHQHAFLWRWHALHHCAPRLSAITATRSHPIDDLMLYLPETILVLVLGFDIHVVAAMYSVVWSISLIKHANLNLNVNWFSKFFQLPRYHLIHHELHGPKDPTYNFSEIMTFWDHVFGTFKDIPISPQHQVGVETDTHRSTFRELFGSLYLPTDKL